MKTIDEIADNNISGWEDFTSGFSSDIKDAMKEYAEEYHLSQLQKKYKPPFCKGCKYWTVIDALGGDYCRVLEKSVASPKIDYKHIDCPL